MTTSPDPRYGRRETKAQLEEELHEELEDELDEMRHHEDPTTVREAFEVEASERGLSEEAGTVGDEDDE